MVLCHSLVIRSSGILFLLDLRHSDIRLVSWNWPWLASFNLHWRNHRITLAVSGNRSSDIFIGNLTMKQIDHDPQENLKLPGQGERRWAKEKFGENVGPRDLLFYLAPFFFTAVALYLWRGY